MSKSHPNNQKEVYKFWLVFLRKWLCSFLLQSSYPLPSGI